MMVENVKDAMPRLQALKDRMDDRAAVNLEYSVWIHASGDIASEWSVWDGTQFFRAPTLDEALHAAEYHHGMTREHGAIPDALVTP